MCDKCDHFTWLLIRNNKTITTHSPHPKALTKKFLSKDQKYIGVEVIYLACLCFVAQTEKSVTCQQGLFTVTILLSGDKV